LYCKRVAEDVSLKKAVCSDTGFALRVVANKPLVIGAGYRYLPAQSLEAANLSRNNAAARTVGFGLLISGERTWKDVEDDSFVSQEYVCEGRYAEMAMVLRITTTAG
jgi:hypothetical protein